VSDRVRRLGLADLFSWYWWTERQGAPVLAQPASRAPSLMWINSAGSNSSDFIKIMLGLKVQDVIGSVMLWTAFVLAVVVLFYMEMKR
jgi:hypothetical protein